MCTHVLAGRPADKADPYAAQSAVPDDCRYLCRMAAGVVNVYRDAGSVERNEPLHMTYPLLYEFLADQAVLTRLISDGPLCVSYLLFVACKNNRLSGILSDKIEQYRLARQYYLR